MCILVGWVGFKVFIFYNYYVFKEQLLVEVIELGMIDFFSYILEGIDEVFREEWLFEIVCWYVGYKMCYWLIVCVNDCLIDF